MSDFDLNAMRAMHYMRAAQHVQEQKRAAVMHPQMQAELNDWLNELDEPKCQSTHDTDGNRSCSAEVVAVKGTCKSEFFICSTSVAYNTDAMHRRVRCSACLAPSNDCWEIRPV